MIRTFINMFKNKDIRKKILFTLAMLFVYRLGCAIPVPGVDATKISASISDNSILGMMNLLGGGSLQNFSVLALGIGPYINSSIIIQLLSMDVIPYLTELAKSGQTGRTKLDKITRYLALVLAFLQAFTMTYAFNVNNGILSNASVSGYIYTAVILTAGTMFLLWLADRISSFGIGNGVSMIIFAGIVANIPFTFYQVFVTLVDTSNSTSAFNGMLGFFTYLVMYFAIIGLVIFMETAERKIPIQYTSSSLQRNKKDITYLPLKINSASVIPVIFASAVMTAPTIIASFFKPNGFTNVLNTVLNMRKPWGLALYGVLIVLFTFFYTNLQVDPDKIAENLSKSGTYIPGIRPGSETKEYLAKVLNRITVLGAAFLLFIALLPYIVSNLTSLGTSAALGGTGIIIVVGVAMETMNNLEGQMTQKAYRGFIKK